MDHDTVVAILNDQLRYDREAIEKLEKKIDALAAALGYRENYSPELWVKREAE